MLIAPGRGIPGLGAGTVPTSTAVETTVGAGASSIGGGLMTAAAATGGISPVGIALTIAGSVAYLLGALGIGSGCGQSCVQASNDANAIETAMRANLAAFQAGQIDRETALANFQALWSELLQACQQIGGGAGKNCIADRAEGACKWRDAKGNCWSWWTGYFDPINNAAAGLPSTAGSPLPSVSPGLVLAGVALLLFAAASGESRTK